MENSRHRAAHHDPSRWKSKMTPSSMALVWPYWISADQCKCIAAINRCIQATCNSLARWVLAPWCPPSFSDGPSSRWLYIDREARTPSMSETLQVLRKEQFDWRFGVCQQVLSQLFFVSIQKRVKIGSAETCASAHEMATLDSTNPRADLAKYF